MLLNHVVSYPTVVRIRKMAIYLEILETEHLDIVFSTIKFQKLKNKYIRIY